MANLFENFLILLVFVVGLLTFMAVCVAVASNLARFIRTRRQ